MKTQNRWRIGLGSVLAVMLAIAPLATMSSTASAAIVETGSVNGGPNSFNQVQPTGGPSQYDTPLERCHTGPDYPISGTNPILGEPLTTSFTTNLPLSLKASYDGGEWYGVRQLIFTNRSAKEFHVDCAVLIFRAPAGGDQHHYANTRAFGHPQQDYLEVPRGDGTSFYIVRLGFHDVPLEQRTLFPGEQMIYKLGGMAGTFTLEQMRDSVRFYGDLNLASNTDLVKKYGTRRLAN